MIVHSFPTPADVVHAALQYDNESNVIHVFDLDLGGTSLTNAMSMELQIVIAQWLELDNFEVADLKYHWMLYHTDGMITMFDNGFVAPSVLEEQLDTKFVPLLRFELLQQQRKKPLAFSA